MRVARLSQPQQQVDFLSGKRISRNRTPFVDQHRLKGCPAAKAKPISWYGAMTRSALRLRADEVYRIIVGRFRQLPSLQYLIMLIEGAGRQRMQTRRRSFRRHDLAPCLRVAVP